MMIRKSKSKLQWDTTSNSLGWLLSKTKTKTQKIISVGEDAEKLVPLYTVGGNVNLYNIMENSMEVP